MTAREIISGLAREGRVEEIVRRVAKVKHLGANLKDLAQMIYASLLDYDEEKIVSLYDSGAINFFIVRMVSQNLFSTTSRYYYAIRVFSARSSENETLENL